MKNQRSDARSFDFGTVLVPALALMLLMAHVKGVQAQSESYSPIAITPPVVDFIDENSLSMVTGKVQFTIPALQMGDVSFTPVSADGPFFQVGGEIEDENYGSIIQCQSQFPNGTSGIFGCAVGASAVALQPIYGLQRETFVLNGDGTYSPYGPTGNGSTFVDNVSANGTCTWTQRDGTNIIFYGFHVSGSPLCQSNNIYQIIHPNGRIATYYYYGALSTQPYNSSPVLSIATNSGYLLKYNYSGTPVFGEETSVTAINRAFESCNPAAVSCTLAASWPTAMLTFQNKPMSVSDNFSSLGSSYNPYLHYIFTIQDSAARKHIFELDSYSRVISYQPPQATSPIYFYSLCTLLSDQKSLINCFGQATWSPSSLDFYDSDAPPLMWDMVNSVTQNGQVWNYSVTFYPSSPPGYSAWWHQGFSPLGVNWLTRGNSTPGTESQYGPIDQLYPYDGTTFQFERSPRNNVSILVTPAGINTQAATIRIPNAGVSTQEGYDVRGNLLNSAKIPIAGSGLASIPQSAVYPSTCTNIVTCNEPTSVTDADGNQAFFTYDSNHGGVLTVTGRR